MASSEHFTTFAFKAESDKCFLGRHESDVLHAAIGADNENRFQGVGDTFCTTITNQCQLLDGDVINGAERNITKVRIPSNINFLNCLLTSVPNLKELHIHSCNIKAEYLTLSSMPLTLQKLRIIEAKVSGNQSWLVELIADLDAQRQSDRKSRVSHFEWRQHPQASINFSTYILAIQKTSMSFCLVDYTHGFPVLIHECRLDNLAAKIDAVNVAVTSLASSRIRGLSWSLESDGTVTLASTCEQNLDRLCRELGGPLRVKEDFSKFPLMKLPEEVLLKLLSNLGAEDLHSITRTCKAMQRIVQDHTLSKLVRRVHDLFLDNHYKTKREALLLNMTFGLCSLNLANKSLTEVTIRKCQIKWPSRNYARVDPLMMVPHTVRRLRIIDSSVLGRDDWFQDAAFWVSVYTPLSDYCLEWQPRLDELEEADLAFQEARRALSGPRVIVDPVRELERGGRGVTNSDKLLLSACKDAMNKMLRSNPVSLTVEKVGKVTTLSRRIVKKTGNPDSTQIF